MATVDPTPGHVSDGPRARRIPFDLVVINCQDGLSVMASGGVVNASNELGVLLCHRVQYRGPTGDDRRLVSLARPAVDWRALDGLSLGAAMVNAPEAHLLVTGEWLDKGLDGLRLGVMELIVRGHARFGMGRRQLRRMAELSAVGDPPDDPVLRTVWEVIGEAQRGSPAALMVDVLQRSYMNYGRPDYWFQNVVAQGLVDRGLAEERTKRLYFVLKTEAYAPTAAGAAEIEPIRSRADALRGSGNAIEPTALALLTTGPGAALTAEAWPEIERVREPIYERHAPGGAD